MGRKKVGASLPSSITFQMEAQWSGAEATGRPALSQMSFVMVAAAPVLSFFFRFSSRIQQTFSLLEKYFFGHFSYIVFKRLEWMWGMSSYGPYEARPWWCQGPPSWETRVTSYDGLPFLSIYPVDFLLENKIYIKKKKKKKKRHPTLPAWADVTSGRTSRVLPPHYTA